MKECTVFLHRILMSTGTRASVVGIFLAHLVVGPAASQTALSRAAITGESDTTGVRWRVEGARGLRAPAAITLHGLGAQLDHEDIARFGFDTDLVQGIGASTLRTTGQPLFPLLRYTTDVEFAVGDRTGAQQLVLDPVAVVPEVQIIGDIAAGAIVEVLWTGPYAQYEQIVVIPFGANPDTTAAVATATIDRIGVPAILTLPQQEGWYDVMYYSFAGQGYGAGNGRQTIFIDLQDAYAMPQNVVTLGQSRRYWVNGETRLTGFSRDYALRSGLDQSFKSGDDTIRAAIAGMLPEAGMEDEAGVVLVEVFRASADDNAHRLIVIEARGLLDDAVAAQQLVVHLDGSGARVDYGLRHACARDAKDGWTLDRCP